MPMRIRGYTPSLSGRGGVATEIYFAIFKPGPLLQIFLQLCQTLGLDRRMIDQNELARVGLEHAPQEIVDKMLQEAQANLTRIGEILDRMENTYIYIKPHPKLPMWFDWRFPSHEWYEEEYNLQNYLGHVVGILADGLYELLSKESVEDVESCVEAIDAIRHNVEVQIIRSADWHKKATAMGWRYEIMEREPGGMITSSIQVFDPAAAMYLKLNAFV